MTRISPEQLSTQLKDSLRNYYLTCGNDPLLLQESLDAICVAALSHGFSERYSYQLDNHTPWNDIINHCHEYSLFSSKKMIVLQATDNGINAGTGEQLADFFQQCHPDILVVLQVFRLTKSQENSQWFKLMNHGVYISCMTPEQHQLPRWVLQRAATIDLHPDEQAVQLLCYCYEGNLLALSQTLKTLSLLYPDGKLTLPRIETFVNDSAHFTAYHWIDALLAGKVKRALHILHQLKAEDAEPLILLRTLQKELLLLLQLQRQMKQTTLRILYDQHKIWQNRRTLLTDALNRMSSLQLTKSVSLLAQIEINLKYDFSYSCWPEFENITLLLCNKTPLENTIND